MGDDDERAPMGDQEPFEPFEGGQIEVVRRLVEEEEIGRFEERLRQGDAGLLAAAEGLDLHLPVRLVEAEPVQDRLGAMLDVVAAARLEGDRGGVIFGHQLFERRVVGRRAEGVFDRGHPLAQGVEGREGIQRLLADVAVAGEPRLLREIGDPQTAHRRDGAAARVLDPGDDFQEGRFADPVRPDDADVLGLADLERDAGENQVADEALFEIVDGQDRRWHGCAHLSTTTARPLLGAREYCTRLMIRESGVEEG